MRIFITLAFFCFTTLSFSQDILRAADSLILNSEYSTAQNLLERNSDKVTGDKKVLFDNKKAEVLIRLGKFDDAEKILKTLSASGNKPLITGVILSNLGFLYLNQGRNDLALDNLRQSIALFENNSMGNSLEAAQALSYLGQVYKFTGKDAQAQEQLLRALSIREKLLKQNHELIAASYNDLGLSFAHIDNNKALDYYEKAIKIYTSLHGNEHPKIAITSINTGIVYRDIELYGDAVNNFETALKIWEKTYDKAHPAKAFALLNLGDTYLKMGNQQAAKGYYERSLHMYEQSYGSKHPETAQVFNALGNFEMASENFDEALHHYQQALIANVKDFDNPDLIANPRLRNYYHGSRLLYSMLFKAEALEKRHFGKTLKFSDLTLSLNTLQSCDSLIDKLRQQSTNESDKIGLGIIANEVYADGVRIAVEASQNAVKKKSFLEMAFYFAEKSKSAVLLEAISDTEAKSFAGIPASLMEEEKNLKSAIALTAQKLSQKPDAEEERKLRETSYALNRSYETFTKKLEQQFPQYFDLKYNAASPSVSELQKLLDQKTAVISYFTDDKNSRLYAFVISHKSFQVLDKAIPKGFDKYITGLRNSLFYNDMKAYQLSSLKLSDILIPRLRTSIKDLIILPTGRLSIIPFEALLTKKPNEKASYQTLPYLLNDYGVRYEFSASLLLQKTKNKQFMGQPSIFLCAPVSFPEKDNLNELPGTESEVKEISRLFESKNLTASARLGTQANESAVKETSIRNYNLLHFATHGVVDETNPELSRIFLQSNSETEDGNLFSGEIYNLQLNANLVTLSACQTGLGKISKGEGVIGLSRALVYAGAQNIIVSFWSVADESTSELMKDFYKLLLDGGDATYCSSLRGAKLDLIKQEKYSAPYYWAPFILIGY
jgi:CHAT domain-containing protein/predicted negative regulator of RcsB-dependent stress response